MHTTCGGWEESDEPSQKKGRVGYWRSNEYDQLYRMSEGRKDDSRKAARALKQRWDLMKPCFRKFDCSSM